MITLFADGLGSLTRRLEPFAGVKLLGVLGQKLAHCSRHGQADVGVNVDLAHAVFDGLLDFFSPAHRRSPSCCHRTGESRPAESCGTEDEPCITRWVLGMRLVDFLDAVNRQDVARGFACELVRTVAGANGNRQCVESACCLTKSAACSGSVSNCSRVMVAIGAVAVFLVALHGLQRAEAAQLSFNGDTDLACASCRRPCESHRRCTRNWQSSCRRPRALPSIITDEKPRLIAPLTNVGVLAVVLVHHQRDVAGTCSIAAWIKCLMKGSPAYLRAPALACRITGAPVSLRSLP